MTSRSIEPPGGAQGVQVLARAASVLRALEGQPQGLSLGQLAKSVGLARSTVQRIVNALSAEGFLVSAGPGGGVRIGPALLRIAASLGADMASMVRPHLRTLSDAVEETVDLSVLSGGSAVFVDQIQGRQRLVALSAVGARFPLHCSANGKAILACFSESDAEELIARSRREHPEFPLRDPERLRRELHKTRQSNLAFDLEEHGTGISAIGTAVPMAFGNPVAFSIPVPTQRFVKRKDALLKAILKFRETISPILSS